jgi:peptide/nickel transport system substrate-binding protein
MNLNKKIKWLWMISILVFLIAGCSSTSEKSSSVEKQPDNKELTFLSNFPAETMDPHLNWTPLRAGVVETLVKITEDMELEPWIADEWSSDANGQNWTFKIKDNITFQNGKKVDALSVKASLERNIQVSEAMKTALKIKAIEVDGQILTINLEQPLPEFPSELVHPNTAIFDVSEEDMDKHPIGTGPFKVVSYESGSKLEVERYQNYWGGKVQLDRATFTFNEDANARTAALQSGDAQIVYRPSLESLEVLKNDQTIVPSVVPSLRTHLLMYNTTNENLKDINVRKALDSLINRQEIVDSIMAGQARVAEGPFLTDYPFTPNYEKKSFGIDLAKKHLEAAGYEIKDGKAVKNGKPLTIRLLTYSYRPELPLIAQLIQSNAKQIGITIEIQVVENIDEYLAGSDKWELATYSINTAPRGDASYFLNSAYMIGGAMNPGQVQNETLSNIIDELNRTVDKDTRNHLASEAIEIIDKERLHSFIVHPNNFAAYRNDIQNWSLSKSEFYVLTKDIDVKTK